MAETVPKPQNGTYGTASQVSETFFNRLVGITEAALISYASKGQISRDTNGGKLPYTVNEKGQKRYKVADLYQCYGFRKQDGNGIEESQKPDGNGAETLRNAVELAVLKERVSRLEDENRDLRQTRDKHLETIQRLTLLLPAPPAANATPAEPERNPEPPKRQSFWKRLFA